MDWLKLGVVFSHGLSLKDWQRLGLLERELWPYAQIIQAHPDYQITFFTYGDQSDLEIPLPQGIEVCPMGKNKFWPWLAIAFATEFRSCSIIKCNQMWGSWLALWASVLWRKKFWARAGYEHYRNHLAKNSPWFKKTASFLVSWFSYHLSTIVTLTSQDTKNFVSSCFKIPLDKIRVHGNYINLQVFKPQRDFSSRLNRVVHVGRLNQHKNLPPLIKACQRLNLGLDLIGQGEEEGPLKKLVADLKSDVQFLGLFPNHQLPEVVGNYRYFCFPSLFEGNPKAILEAMALECFVIGGNVQGTKEIIDSKVNGLLCSPDEEGIYQALKWAIENPLECQNMAKAARVKIQNHYSPQSFVDFELKVIGDLLK